MITPNPATQWRGLRVFVEELAAIARAFEQLWLEAGKTPDAAMFQSSTRDERDQRFLVYFTPGASAIVDGIRSGGHFRGLTIDTLASAPLAESVAFCKGDRAAERLLR